jgi:hypothetical protein
MVADMRNIRLRALGQRRWGGDFLITRERFDNKIKLPRFDGFRQK